MSRSAFLRRPYLGAILVIGVVLGGMECAEERRAPKRSVLLVTIDSWRADEAWPKPGAATATPAISKFLSESIRYRRAYSAAPWTTPSSMSLLTGLPAAAHGVESDDRALSESVTTLAERFKRDGYRTAAFVSAVTLRGEFGFARGFDSYDLVNYGHTQLSTPELISKVEQRIDSWRDSPFFVWVHLWDPHYNYNPPSPYDQQFRVGVAPANRDVQCLKWRRNPVSGAEAEWLRGQYRGELAYTDKGFEELMATLDRLALRERTIVAVAADHGEAFLEHGWLGHTIRVDEELVHVPLALRIPGRQPFDLQQVVSTVGLGSTLLSIAAGDSVSLGLSTPLPLEPADKSAAPSALSETVRQGCFTSLVEQRWKLVLEHRSCRAELFDLDSDPLEALDRAATAPGELARLKQELKARLEQIAAAGIPHASIPKEVRESTEEQLRTLGYLGGKRDRAAAPGLPADPCAPPSDAARDLFGDLLVSECPAGGALRCLR